MKMIEGRTNRATSIIYLIFFKLILFLCKSSLLPHLATKSSRLLFPSIWNSVGRCRADCSFSASTFIYLEAVQSELSCVIKSLKVSTKLFLDCSFSVFSHSYRTDGIIETFDLGLRM